MTIIGLAQEFVGSNNLNVLDPNGQFGTRLQVCRSPYRPPALDQRFIGTMLIFCVTNREERTLHPLVTSSPTSLRSPERSSSPPTTTSSTTSTTTDSTSSLRGTFPFSRWSSSTDPTVSELVGPSPLLSSFVEIDFAIFSGWSSSVPNYNPSDIVANLKRKMAGEELEPMHPWYRGFNVRPSFVLLPFSFSSDCRVTADPSAMHRERSQRSRRRKTNTDVLESFLVSTTTRSRSTSCRFECGLRTTRSRSRLGS